MNNISKLLLLIMIILITVTACTSTKAPGEKGQEIISARDTLKSISGEEAVLVDAQNSSAYKDGHVEGAVNISRNDITTFGPFPNMLAPAEKIEKVLGEKGIANDSTVIVYDNNNNMDAARLWWTMKVYGHEDVKVVSGGLKALLKAGAEKSTLMADMLAVKYEITEKNEEMLASREDVKAEVNNPQDDVVLLDVRTQEEYNAGTIPASVHLNYEYNNFDDGTFRPVRQIHTLYRDKEITPEKTVIMYCKTSIRAAQTYLALYNAGYRDLKIYDGAWIEWSSDTSLPVEIPDGTGIKTNFQDGS
ncbi:sulfurtransferase [Halocella sp. SP3-1]|uniref:sulfurtransferase n=1 Tax=Halocella sp. SP3-1 TaxID=2382161 RepID=UPI000F75580A|nr:sulfurtransferase [Halocella sp. SP3-1]AZO96068.1 sulfurtransferase [Halocella sp. SP3-1]